MSDGMTREDLREALRDINQSINRGMDGVHDRLDILNGRTGKLESLAAVHEERWQRLDKATSVKSTPSAHEDMGLSKEWKTLTLVGSMAAGAIYGLVQGVIKLAQILGAIAKP